MHRYLSFAATTFTALTALSALPVQAQTPSQNYPLKPITLIVPFAPGGGTDSIARDVGKALGEKLGQVVIIENKGGAGGSIGANAVAKAPADGYTLLFATSTFVTNAAAEATPSYNIEKDFSPIAMIGRGPLLVVASKEMGVKTIAQLRTAMAARPDGTNYCSSGNGSINHLSGELFRQKTQLAMTHVPYKGSGPATVDLLAGRIQLFFATVPTILPYVLDNRVELLAVTGAKRSPLFPSAPTMAEAGIKGFEISTWWGVLAPAKTPQSIIDKLNVAINEAAARDPMRSRLSHEGADAVSGSPADFRKALVAETVLWREVAKTAGLKPN
ncbi:tripartite tricarboxylate transporter substrate binding protein [Polaromonas eurypsychrophila]|uniref:MFS transporter n=1 Tax=Polaromonas eurypsychrophila TaxID=1614635 RepID=A0A916SQW0_9BURK|nr:tripartite tricarboxylate transporter substrate binding protein [Polaromonas eurypsychrophila]GGB11938.1 MFS transporter [Polaromonas eurypsychrophila]